MPKLSEIKDSPFLTKDQVGRGMLLTITGCHQEEVGRENEKLWCLTFKEVDKMMVLKSTNAQLIQSFLGGDDTDQWIGKQVVLYNDPQVQMGGKFVGGIRVRAPRTPPSAQPVVQQAIQGAPPPPPQPAAVPYDPADDVPF